MQTLKNVLFLRSQNILYGCVLYCHEQYHVMKSFQYLLLVNSLLGVVQIYILGRNVQKGTVVTVVGCLALLARCVFQRTGHTQSGIQL